MPTTNATLETTAKVDPNELNEMDICKRKMAIKRQIMESIDRRNDSKKDRPMDQSRNNQTIKSKPRKEKSHPSKSYAKERLESILIADRIHVHGNSSTSFAKTESEINHDVYDDFDEEEEKRLPLVFDARPSNAPTVNRFLVFLTLVSFSTTVITLWHYRHHDSVIAQQAVASKAVPDVVSSDDNRMELASWMLFPGPWSPIMEASVDHAKAGEKAVVVAPNNTTEDIPVKKTTDESIAMLNAIALRLSDIENRIDTSLPPLPGLKPQKVERDWTYRGKQGDMAVYAISTRNMTAISDHAVKFGGLDGKKEIWLSVGKPFPGGGTLQSIDVRGLKLYVSSK